MVTTEKPIILQCNQETWYVVIMINAIFPVEKHCALKSRIDRSCTRATLFCTGVPFHFKDDLWPTCSSTSNLSKQRRNKTTPVNPLQTITSPRKKSKRWRIYQNIYFRRALRQNGSRHDLGKYVILVFLFRERYT